MANRRAPVVASLTIPERVQRIEQWAEERDVCVDIPTPAVTDEEYQRWQKKKQDIFWRPPTDILSFDAAMEGSQLSFGERVSKSHIRWEPVKDGYWFQADLPGGGVYCGSPNPDVNVGMGNFLWDQACNRMQAEQMLLASVEELAIIFSVQGMFPPQTKEDTCIAWLRTRIGKDKALLFNENGNVIGCSTTEYIGSIAHMSILIVGARGVKKIPNAA